MEMSLAQHQIDSLADLAARTGRPAGELLSEAVERLLAEEAWFDRQVRIGLEQIARGEFLEEEEMELRFQQLMRR